MFRKSKLLAGEALLKRAAQLGVDTAVGEYVTIPGTPNIQLPALEYEIQQRVMSAERHFRDRSLWLLAFISAIASMLSAAAAWWAVTYPPSTSSYQQPPSVTQGVRR